MSFWSFKSCYLQNIHIQIIYIQYTYINWIRRKITYKCWYTIKPNQPINQLISKTFCNILVYASLLHMYHMNEVEDTCGGW